MESTEVVHGLMSQILEELDYKISWIEAGKRIGQFAIHKAYLLMNNATDCFYQCYDAIQENSKEDEEPKSGVLDPWGQPKLKLVQRVIQNASPIYSHKSPSPDQLSVISESRRKSMALQRRMTGKKNSSILKLTSNQGSEVSRLEVQEEGSARGNGNKTKTRDQIALDLKLNEEGFSEDFTKELEQEMREKMARIQAYRKKTALEKQEAERRKKYGGVGNTMKPEIARVLTNDLKRLNSEITQEAFYRETGNEQMKINNTTGYKFTFDAQGNVLLTKKNPLSKKQKIEPEENLQFEVKQGVQGSNLEKANLEALGGQEGLTTYDLDTSDRHSNRLKTLTLKSAAHSVKKTSIQGDKRNKKQLAGDLYSEEIPILSELTDVQPAPSKALNLNSGVSLIEDGKKPIQGPQLQRDRMTLGEYQQLQSLQQSDMKIRFKNLEFFKRQESRQKKKQSINDQSLQDLKVTTKTRFKQLHSQGLREIDSTPVNRPVMSRSAVGASFLDHSGIDQSITTHQITPQELYCKMVDKGVLFKTREQKMDEKIIAYDTQGTARNLSYNPRRAAQLKHKPVAIVEEARKALLELDNPYSKLNLNKLEGLHTSYSSNQLLSPPSRVIAYSQEERNKKAPKRVPFSTFDKFNQSLIRGETPQVGQNKHQNQEPPIPALPKVHRDVSAKEFYYGPATQDPLKQAKSMIQLGATGDSKVRKNTSKMPRERNLAHSALASEQKLNVLQSKIKVKKSPNPKQEKSARKKVIEKSLREMLRDDSITQIV